MIDFIASHIFEVLFATFTAVLGYYTNSYFAARNLTLAQGKQAHDVEATLRDDLLEIVKRQDDKIDKLERSQTAAVELLEKVHTENKQLRSDNEILKRDNKELVEVNSVFVEELQALKESNNKLRADNKRIIEENLVMKNTREGLTARVSELEKELTILKNGNGGTNGHDKE